MILIEEVKIEVRQRQRKTMDAVRLSELEADIAERGLLHPPVFWQDTETRTWVLAAGQRRLTAMRRLHEKKIPFKHDGQIVPPWTIPATRLEDLTNVLKMFEVELSENVYREDLSWVDRVRAYAELHELRQAQNIGHSREDTAKELLDRGLVKTLPTGRLHMKEATLIADHLDNPKIALARNPAEALGLVYKMEEEKITAALVKRKLATLPTASSVTIRHGSCLDIFDGLDSEMADLILTDPPYGLGASGAGFRGRTVHHHNYEDTRENAQKIARAILTEGFRICKTRANIFMFCDIDLFDWLKSTASNMGWTPFRRPLIWQKSESEGMAPWGGSGPRITTEFIFFATKGQRGLNASPIDVFNVKRVSRSERIHAAEKPVELLKTLIQCSTLPGDFVLDPCAGSGSTLVAAKELRRTGLGIEFDLDYYRTAMANVFGGDLNATQGN